MARRLRFQSTEYLYEVRSVIKFDRHGTKEYKTYYGSDRRISENEILQRAKGNINNKLENSSGRIIKLEIAAVYR